MQAQARRAVGLGGLAVLAGLALGLGGAPAVGTALAVAGVAAIALATRRAIAATDAVPPADPTPRRSGVAVQAAVAADLLLGAVWTSVARVRRAPDLARAAADVEAALERWRASGWLADPARAHAPPPPLEKPTLARCAVRGGGTAEHLRFASEFEASELGISAAAASTGANGTAHALLWRHRNGSPRPALIVVHGFGMGRLGADVPWLRLRGLDLVGLHRDLDLDVAYAILPFHGPRAASALSGGGFFDGHPLAATAALAQAVWDVRRLAGWLRAQGAPAVGVLGLSLGGCVAALHASLDPALACTVPTIPAVDLAEIFWSQLPPARRGEWERAGLGRERLAGAWSLVAPLRHRVVAAAPGRLVIAGAFDQLAPPQQARALWAHWGQPAIHWLPGGHLAWLGGAPLQQRLREHLRATLRPERPRSSPVLSRFRA
jgi:hypothetical protein